MIHTHLSRIETLNIEIKCTLIHTVRGAVVVYYGRFQLLVFNYVMFCYSDLETKLISTQKDLKSLKLKQRYLSMLS